MTYRPPFVSDKFIMLEPPHPATLEEADLLKQCSIEFGRVGGPGGQHRNRNDTAAWVVHRPSQVECQATERRSQAQNRHEAIKRLRRKLAVRVRTVTSRDHHAPSELWRRRRQGEKMSVNPEHSDYPALLAEALDVVVARRFDVAGAAGILGITMSQLARLIRHEKQAFAALNHGRESVGLPKLRG